MKSSGNGSRRTPTKKNGERRQNRISEEVPLFAFDTLKEGYNWGRPKRKIKTVSRFDPTTKEKRSGCRIGHGFICPQCSAVCTYDSTKCYQCHLECIYEAGVGVVVLQDRPSNEKAKVEKRVKTSSGKTVEAAKPKENFSSIPMDVTDACDGYSIKGSTLSTSQNKGGTALYKNKPSRKKNIFANLKEKVKAATESNLECGQGKNHDDMESRMREATEEWKESIIAEAKNGAYSAASINPNILNDHPQNSEGEIYRSQSSEAVVPITEPPSMKSDHNCLEGLKQQLLALQLKHDAIVPNVLRAEEELGGVLSKLEAAILQRNKDAAVFSKEIISCGFKIAEIEKGASSLTAERDEFKKRVEAKGLSSVPNIVPNYSTRIDALQTKMSEMKTKCDAAQERVKDLMSGNEAAKQCQKEIDSFKRQLTDVTAKNSAMATEKAVLIEKVLSTLIYVSKLRGMAENQKARISELESSVESLTADRDTVVEESKKQIDRLEAEKVELQTRLQVLSAGKMIIEKDELSKPRLS